MFRPTHLRTSLRHHTPHVETGFLVVGLGAIDAGWKGSRLITPQLVVLVGNLRELMHLAEDLPIDRLEPLPSASHDLVGLVELLANPFKVEGILTDLINQAPRIPPPM